MSAHSLDLVSVDAAVNGMCVPKTRFCNIGDEVCGGQAVTVRFSWKCQRSAVVGASHASGDVLAKPVLTFFGWAGTALMAVTVVALLWSSFG
jgi:hypothetical protein